MRNKPQVIDYAQIQIDKGVPLPERKRGKAPKVKPFLEKLEVGDSFVAPVTINNCYRFRAIATQIGIELTMRGLKEEGATRIWRTK